MALANFIDRAATSASQVLANFQLDAFKARLKQHVVGLVVDGAAAKSLEGRWTAELAVNLLARLYPKLALVAADDADGAFMGELYALAVAINPLIGVSSDLAGATVCLAVGESRVTADCQIIYLGSAGWRARLSTTAPPGCGASALPYGAGAAACFGAANVFRTIFGDEIEGGEIDRELDVSLFDFSQNGIGIGPDLGAVDLGETHLVGAGAIGNAALWALKRDRSLRGLLHVIDHETVELSNLQRYVLADQSHDGALKVDMASGRWDDAPLTLTPHPLTWSGYVQVRQDWRLERVAVALDNVPDRITVQGALPKRILNAWTQENDLGVSRHGFADGGPCLCCLYIPTGKTKDEHVLIAEALRLPAAADQIKTLLQLGSPVDAAFVAAVAEAFAVSFDDLERFVGQPVRSFYQGAICGGLMLSLTGDDNAGATVVPMAFQSALAGIMLAAEIVKDAADQRPVKQPITRINLLRPLAPYLNDPRVPDASGRCLCADAVFKAAHRRKYGSRAAVAQNARPA